MGYEIYQHRDDTKFTLPERNKRDALKALKAYTGRMSYVRPERIEAARTLEEAMDECGWHFDVDDDGNIVGIDHQAADHYIGAEKIVFGLIAPFVDAGSFIHVHGHDGEHWKWVFDGETVAEKIATISFD